MRSLALYGPRMCWFQGARRLLTGGRIGCLIGLPPGEPIVTQIRFDQAGCFWAAGTGVFKPASRASLSARNRAVFSRVAARVVSYSAIACCPSRSCCSFFLKAASARSRARLASVSNLVTPFRANPLAGQLSCPRTGCRLSMWEAQPSQRRSRLFVPRAPRAGRDSFRRQDKAQAALDSVAAAAG